MNRRIDLRLLFTHGANCCDRVRWVLNYKQIEHGLIDVESNEGQKSLGSANIFGRVPVLLIRETPLAESMAIAVYLEELAPEPALLGVGHVFRAQVREVCEAVNSSIHPVQNSSVLRAVRPEWTKN